MATYSTLGKIRPSPKGLHDSSKSYDVLDLVMKEGDLKAYISVKQVPPNIELSNQEYWRMYLDMSAMDDAVLEVYQDKFDELVVTDGNVTDFTRFEVIDDTQEVELVTKQEFDAKISELIALINSK